MASGKEADFQDNATLVTDIDVAVGGTGVQTVMKFALFIHIFCTCTNMHNVICGLNSII